MKTYKIIEDRINYNSQDFGEMGKFIRVEYALNILKEALSDKEESKLGSFAGTFCGKNIYFECEDKKIWDNFQKALQSKSFLFEKPKQEEEGPCGCPYFCHKHLNPKQSTSLEGEIERIIGLHTHEDRIDKTDIAEDVLSLIQSHLLKEIEDFNPDYGELGGAIPDFKERLINKIKNL